MKRAPTLSILLALLLLVAAACSSGASPEASATPEPTPTPTPEPTVAVASGPAAPSLGEGAGDLASVLPTEVSGLTIQYSHTSGQDVFGEELTPEAAAFLERVGGDPERISTAFGFAFDAEAGTGVSIVAFRVEGTDSETLRSAFIEAMEEEGGTPVGEETTVGGKTVTFIGFEDATNGYLYVNGDVVFVVSGEPIELAEEAIEALP